MLLSFIAAAPRHEAGGMRRRTVAVCRRIQAAGQDGPRHVDGEDALAAALEVKKQRPDAVIMYVRRQIGAATRVTRDTGAPQGSRCSSSV